jgi:hypothetical protein
VARIRSAIFVAVLSTVVPAPGSGQSGAGPREPSGFLPVLHFRFTPSPDDFWRPSAREGIVQASVSDPSAPVSAAWVGQTSFQAGWGSNRPMHRFRQVLGGGTTDLYLAVALKLSPGWKGRPGGIDNVLTFRLSPGDAKPFSIVLLDARSATVKPRLRLQDLAAGYQGSKSPWLAANLNPLQTVSHAKWYRLELRVKLNTAGGKDGTLQWWLDGAPMGYHEDIGFVGDPADGIWDLEWAFVPPTNGLQAPQTLWLDDAYVSIAGGGDRVVLVNHAESKTGGDPHGIVAADGRFKDGSGPARCLNDRLMVKSLVADNLLPSAGCPPFASTPFRDEIVVYSADDRMVVERASGAAPMWSPGTGEVRAVGLGEGVISVPVTVRSAFLVEDECDDVVLPRYQCDLATANLLFRAGRTGLRFHIVNHLDQSNDQTAIQQIGTGCEAGVEQTGHFTEGMINVYYVQRATDNAQGVQCGATSPNVIYVSSFATVTTLAHEFGHAFSLEHVGDVDVSFYADADGTPRFTLDNLMWSGGAWQNDLSLGQTFRINEDASSMLLLNGLRPGLGRKCECRLDDPTLLCPDWQTFRDESDRDDVCPRISRGWSP